MYTGHLGIALGAKGLRASAPLWLLILATQAPDWVDAALCLNGPLFGASMWSHSIPAALAIAATLSLVCYGFTRDGAAAGLVGAVSVSHVLVDYITGIKPTWPGGPMIGLGLYSHPFEDFALEVTVVGVGWLLYRRSLPTQHQNGRLTRILLIALVGAQLLGALRLALLPHVPKCS